MTDYALLNRQLLALLEDEPDRTANLANAAALLMDQLPDLNWAGFYLVGPGRGAADPDELVLGPFQGKPACLRLPYNRGVCGTSWARGEAVLVDDVHAFPGHIACDAASASELVLPIPGPGGRVVGVLDLDSPTRGRFTRADRDGLTPFAARVGRLWDAPVT